MNRILIVGATGAVGRAVADQLIAAGVRDVRALSRNPDASALPSDIEVVRGDLDNPKLIRGMSQRSEDGVPGVDGSGRICCSCD